MKKFTLSINNRSDQLLVRKIKKKNLSKNKTVCHILSKHIYSPSSLYTTSNMDQPSSILCQITQLLII